MYFDVLVPVTGSTTYELIQAKNSRRRAVKALSFDFLKCHQFQDFDTLSSLTVSDENILVIAGRENELLACVLGCLGF